MNQCNTDYHDRLEQEVTRLKRDIILLDNTNTQLMHDLKVLSQSYHRVHLDNEQLRQAIAAFNNEPTNSL